MRDWKIAIDRYLLIIIFLSLEEAALCPCASFIYQEQCLVSTNSWQRFIERWHSPLLLPLISANKQPWSPLNLCTCKGTGPFLSTKNLLVLLILKSLPLPFVPFFLPLQLISKQRTVLLLCFQSLQLVLCLSAPWTLPSQSSLPLLWPDCTWPLRIILFLKMFFP